MARHLTNNRDRRSKKYIALHEGMKAEVTPHELLPFLAIWAIQYQKDYGLNGLHPTHYDLLEKYGARMDSFVRATGTVSEPDKHTRHRQRSQEHMAGQA